MDFFQLLLENHYMDFVFDFALNLITVTILCYFIYYRRYKDKEAFTSYMLFNVFIFTVISVLFNSSESISMGVWFGLFAILSIVTLRSETLSKREITYFFGTLSIALINSIWLSDYTFIILCNSIIVIWAWIIDHPSILPGIYGMKITLDHIPEWLLHNSTQMLEVLSKKFGIDVISYSVSNVDYVKDTARLKITYSIHK